MEKCTVGVHPRGRRRAVPVIDEPLRRRNPLEDRVWRTTWPGRRIAGNVAEMVRLAGIMAQHPEMRLQHVHAHTGHPLNEAADALASLAQRGLPAVETRSRAESLVEAFVQTWRDRTSRE